jgi:hypothetical protein
MNMADPIIEMKGSLKQLQLENMIVQKIRNELIESFPNMQDVKMNVDLIRQICCAIENHVNGEKVDKLALFMKIHRSCFGVVDKKEMQTLTNIIKYLNDNDKIKARSLLSKIWRFLKAILLKKLIHDTSYNSAQSQLIKYSYNNVISTITYRVVKQILKFNVLKFIFLKMGLHYKLVVVLILILA